jgi:hypothetical protein
MAILPDIQYKENSSEVLLFWDVTKGFSSYSLYWSAVRGGTQTLIKQGIPNQGSLSKKSASYRFDRKDVGLAEKDSFFVILEGVPSDPPGPAVQGEPRFIPYLSDQPATAGSVHSPITGSERKQLIANGTAQRVTFTQDLKQLEVFNFTQDVAVFIDVTGLNADPALSMPLMPYGFYSIGRNLSKDTGISIISPDGNADIRIVAHF